MPAQLTSRSQCAVRVRECGVSPGPCPPPPTTLHGAPRTGLSAYACGHPTPDPRCLLPEQEHRLPVTPGGWRKGLLQGSFSCGGTLCRPPTLVSPSRSVLALCKRFSPNPSTWEPHRPRKRSQHCTHLLPILSPLPFRALAMILPKMNSLSCLNPLIKKKKFLGTCLGRCQWFAAGQLGKMPFCLEETAQRHAPRGHHATRAPAPTMLPGGRGPGHRAEEAHPHLAKRVRPRPRWRLGPPAGAGLVLSPP